jgi:predicted ArsR family transcriptional regulator
MVNTLRDGLADADSNAQLIDAESASGLLGISARTARRVLQDLAREGLVWPVPASAVTPGRPRQTYRLVGARS